MTLADTIATAIRKADSSYFFEDYRKQANAVIAALETEGYIVLPKTPTEEMTTAGKEAILSGRVKAENLAQTIYSAMVACGGGRKKRA